MTTSHRFRLSALPGYIILGCLPIVGCAERSNQERIENILLRQSVAWNAGDIDVFMEPYWHSDDLTFTASGETTRGWDATLERYKQRYPDRRAMGTLDFSDLDIEILSHDVALVLGKWHLTRDDGDIGGGFSLVFQRIDGRWVIRHDHTSRFDPS